MPSFDQTPDKPVSFGYKVRWFAVKTSDPAGVLDALEFGNGIPANWASGLAAADPSVASRIASPGSAPWVFISPAVNGWVLIVSGSFPYPVAPTERVNEFRADIGEKFDVPFSRLMTRFADVQFFGNHRVGGFTAWARAQAGEPRRVFTFADGVLANVGAQTPEEASLKFANLSGLTASAAEEKFLEIAQRRVAERSALEASGLSPREAIKISSQNNRGVPDETDVVDLAGLWSIDPTHLSDQDHPPGFGLAVRLPEGLKV